MTYWSPARDRNLQYDSLEEVWCPAKVNLFDVIASRERFIRLYREEEECPEGGQ